MGVTLNKDGTPRKIGSGKTKGAGCYAKISLRELRKLVDNNEEVSVSRMWLEAAQSKKKADSINFDLKAPKVKPQYSQPTSRPSPPRKTDFVQEQKDPSISSTSDEDEYEPPPLFASDAGVKNY